MMQTADPDFPVGKARLETLGVLGCAAIMSVAAYEVVQDSVVALYNGFAKGMCTGTHKAYPQQTKAAVTDPQTCVSWLAEFLNGDSHSFPTHLHCSACPTADDPPEIDAGVLMYSVLGVATVLKVTCYIQCVALKKMSGK